MAQRATEEQDTKKPPQEFLQSIVSGVPTMTTTGVTTGVTTTTPTSPKVTDLNEDGRDSALECQRNYLPSSQDVEYTTTITTTTPHQVQQHSSLKLLLTQIQKMQPLVNNVKQIHPEMAELTEHLSKSMLLTMDCMKRVLPQPRLNVDDLPASTSVGNLVVSPVSEGFKEEDVSPGHAALSGGNFASPEATTSRDESGRKKRKRTKFTDDQKMKLEALATGAKWVLANLPKEEQEKAAAEIGIKVDSLKYWFHNTKQKGRKKQNVDETRS